jgi:hypothetical protein
LGSSLPPAELAQRDLGIFEELKHLFSIALKVRRSGEVTEQVYAKKHATDVAVQRLSPNPSGAVRDYVKRDRRGLRWRRTLARVSIAKP